MSEYSYLQLLNDIFENGVEREDRTGVGTIGVFGRQIRFDLADGFPLLTTKRVFFKGVVAELLWFLSGSTNAKVLEDQGVNIWKAWGDPVTRELGPIYSQQWRSWAGLKMVTKHFGEDGEYSEEVPTKIVIDQISNVLHSLKTNPNSRRHIVSAWNPADIDDMALPPCHCLFQFNVRTVGPLQYLDCQLYQRSADVLLGVPFNFASYALLTILIAEECGFIPGEFVHTFGDVHLYNNHIEQAKLQLTRVPKSFPKLSITNCDNGIFGYTLEDIKLVGYDPYPAIKAPVAV